MGNICSSSKNRPSSSGDEAFSRPGRVLGSSANAAPRASVPASAKSKSHFSSPGRTLGGSGGGSGAGTTDASATAGSGTGSGTGTRTVDEAGSSADDARARAALAAQKRAETGNTVKGKLGTKLAAQKAQTQAQALNEASRDERAARDADDASAARRWE
ncbi:uncharacterized protein BDV14DRAFT_196399 [Aspergillus stella-maris]|uniref:uncharacterized protein n=1 Tax=Aspergillus stella-maris TaxID=1810926 RepID=UPI003CCD0BF6